MIRGVRLPAIFRGGGLLFLIAVTLTNFLNFLFQLLMARELGPSSYGELGALTGLLFVFSVPSAALQVVITAQVAGRLRGADGKPIPLVVGPLLSSAVIWGLATTVVLLACAPLLKEFFHLSSITPALLLALYVLPTMIDLVPRGVLLGEMRFVRVSIALVTGSLLRLGLALLLTPSRGVSGAMAANVLGALVTAGVMLLWIKPFMAHKGEDSKPIRVSWKMASAAIIAFAGYWILNSTDVFFGRHFLDRHDSGLYSAAATTASIALFVSGALATASFPRFAAAGGVGPAARAALSQALGITALMGTVVALAFTIGPDLVTKVLFGADYESAGSALSVLAFAAVATSLISVLMQFHLAGSFGTAAALSWLGVALIAGATFFFHDSITQIAIIKLVAAGAVVALMVFLAYARRHQGEAPRTTTDDDILTTAEPELELTMVVPYYNPGPALRDNIENLAAVLTKLGRSFEIIAVSDGATDGSEKSLEGLDPNIVRSVVLPVNAGKGQALRVGFTLGRGKYLGFIDADGDVNPSLIEPYLAIVDLYHPDVVLGSKRHPMSEVHYPPLRHVYSWGYQQVIRLMFNLKVRDTQTGLKLIRREVLAEVLPRMVEKRFAFDLEMFVVAKHLGFLKFFEAPVRIDHQFTSTISRSTWVGTLMDTMAIFYRLHLLHYYDRPRTVVSAELPPVDKATVPVVPVEV
jgi:O-antigen/teichoic acid export membrane protein